MPIRQGLRASLAAASLFAATCSTFAQERVITENFASDPAARGWERSGDANLFQRDSAAENLRAVWDSSHANSYFVLPLGVVLTRRDDFSAALDLTLEDASGGASAGKPGALQMAFGFQNRHDALKPSFIRGTGSDSPNLVEFNYFPDTGFGATVWPAVLSTNSGVNYNGASDFTLFELPTGVMMRVSLEYRASNETMTVSIRTNGVLAGPIASARLSTNRTEFAQPFTDFAVDAFAISSYSEAGQAPDFAGSLLAHGVIDNIELRVPPLPVREPRIATISTGAQVSFIGLPGWIYQVEQTADFRTWNPAGPAAMGGEGAITVTDSNGGGPRFRFYRVAALRPQ